jgi:hypothetical protein
MQSADGDSEKLTEEIRGRDTRRQDKEMPMPLCRLPVKNSNKDESEKCALQFEKHNAVYAVRYLHCSQRNLCCWKANKKPDAYSC